MQYKFTFSAHINFTNHIVLEMCNKKINNNFAIMNILFYLALKQLLKFSMLSWGVW